MASRLRLSWKIQCLGPSRVKKSSTACVRWSKPCWASRICFRALFGTNGPRRWSARIWSFILVIDGKSAADPYAMVPFLGRVNAERGAVDRAGSGRSGSLDVLNSLV